MNCNSGIYEIKLKIDKIYFNSGSFGNMIGLTSDNFGNGCTGLGKDGK